MAIDTLLLVAALATFNPDHWQFFPSMDEVRCIATSPNEIHVAVPEGVYVLRRTDYRLRRTITSADGIRGRVRLAARNPARGELLIAAEEGLYRYVSATRTLAALDPPFRTVRSIGIADDGAYFVTESGLYRRRGAAPGFDKVQSAPERTTWYGGRDTLEPRDYPFLVPYFLTDDRLDQHPITLVRPGHRNKKLFVAANRYGIDVYNINLGLREKRIRLGPQSETIRRIARSQDKLWFISDNYATSLDAHDNWEYHRTLTTDLPVPGIRVLLPRFAELRRREGINALLDGPNQTLVGTDRNLYSLGPTGELTSLFNFGRAVYGLARRGDSTLIATDVGLFVMTKDSFAEILEPFDRTGLGVYSIAGSENGTTWFGTIGGVLALDTTGEWNHITPPGFDLSQPVRNLAAANGLVFFEDGLGITVYDSEHNYYSRLDRTSGLPSVRVSALHADSSYLWIASPGIITRFDYQAELRN